MINRLFLLLLLATASSSLYAQKYVAPTSSSCISYDYSGQGTGFKNNCSQPITLSWFYFGESGGGTLDLQPRSVQGTGDYRGKRYDLYICPLDYIAVDYSDQPVKATGTTYRCKIAPWHK